MTISNTVSEHIEPARFYGGQHRVLKPGGVCLVLSSRKGIHLSPDWFTVSEFERQFWEKAERYDDTMEKYSVCKYPMSEAQLPATMEKYGFKVINAKRYSDLGGIDSALCSLTEHYTQEEGQEMKRLTNAKYDTRIQQYDRGEKQWDTSVSIIMVVRGIK